MERNNLSIQQIFSNKDIKINLLNYFRNETKLKYEEIEQPIQYDCFLICYKDTIRETDLKIARQIKVKDKGPHFFLVRTHMDKAVEDKEGILGRILTKKDEEDLFKEIRDNANECLVVNNLSKDVDDDRNIFLVSALLRKVEKKITDNRNKFDFEKLQFEILNKLKSEKKTLINGNNNNLYKRSRTNNNLSLWEWILKVFFNRDLSY